MKNKKKKIYYLCSCGEEFFYETSTITILKHLFRDVRKYGVLSHIEKIEEKQ